MPNFDAVFAGVDPTSARGGCSYAVLDLDLKLIALTEGELEGLVACLARHRSATVAVNSPSGVNRGLVREILQSRSDGSHQVRGADMRLVEHELRSAGIAVAGTPSRVGLCPAWMQAGFEIYRELSKAGFQQAAPPAAERRLIETQPEACFRVILGRAALPKPTLEGRLQRQAALHERGLQVTDPMMFFEEITRHRLLQGALPVDLILAPEQLDALVAAYTAWLAFRDPSAVQWIGAESEGQVVLPGTITVPTQ